MNPVYLYHGSRYQQTELMPGFLRSGELVVWDEVESNKFLYTTSSEGTAAELGFASSIEKIFNIENFLIKDGVMYIQTPDKLTFEDLASVVVYVYTIRYRDADKWMKNDNQHNGIGTEYKTKETITAIADCEQLDVGNWLRRFKICVCKEMPDIEGGKGKEIVLETLTVSHKEQLQAWVDTLSEKVQRNVEVVTPADVHQDYMLHVSIDTNLKTFVPRIGENQAPSEDRTVPRVCVAPTILGCLSGFGASEHFFHEFAIGEKNGKGVTYKGGMRIYMVPFNAALKPNQRLVFDARHSDEYWLVPYNRETATYEPQMVGKVFFESIRYIPRDGKQPMSEGTLYVDVQWPEGLHFTNGIHLRKGYWTIEGPTPAFTTMTWAERTNNKLFKVKEISKADFMSVKQRSAALLSEDGVPNWSQW